MVCGCNYIQLVDKRLTCNKDIKWAFRVSSDCIYFISSLLFLQYWSELNSSVEWMSRGISPTQPNHPLLKLHSGSSVGLTCFNETHRQHAWEKERHRQCIRKLCSHPCCSLLWKGSNKHVLQIFTQSEAHVFSSHTQSTPLTYQYVMVISIHSLTWRNSQYHPNDLYSPAQHQPNKVEYHDRIHKNNLYYRYMNIGLQVKHL